ncbi:imidazole glycerol phosphate synthase subunit HisH [Burkholderiaceae bacterium DAT-1]|nr:imidazole glycerol phosphate synthase subunit HisH [Burkholderiaceae bacterium DAT-1]
MMSIAIVDYGMGNLRSVEKALAHVAPDREILLTSDPEVIRRADHVVFPGQGAMRDCVAELDQRGLREAVMQATRDKPFLGICVGAQLLLDRSEEGGDTAALGCLAGDVVRFPDELMVGANGERLKVPHMGWNEVWHQGEHPLWRDIPDGDRFYFVHSYFLRPHDENVTVGWSEYPFRFSVAMARANIFACQFHPEKSHRAGLALLRNFVTWDGVC